MARWGPFFVPSRRCSRLGRRGVGGRVGHHVVRVLAGVGGGVVGACRCRLYSGSGFTIVAAATLFS